jgi:hypothetical protein
MTLGFEGGQTMRFPAISLIRFARIWILALLAGSTVGALALAPAALAAEEFGVKGFQTGACKNVNPKEGCTEPATQAGSHPVFSVTAFTFNNEAGNPVGPVKRIRVDSPAGFITNPHAIPTCENKELEEGKCPPASQMGVEVATVYVGGKDVTAELPVFNMVPPPGRPADFAYMSPTGPVNILGGVSWYDESEKVKGGVPTGDSHEYYEILGISNATPLVSSTLLFLSAPNSTFLTVPTSCIGPTTNYLEVESYTGQIKNYSFTPVPPATPVTLQTTGCDAVPFEPSLALSPETKQSDAPTGATVEVKVPQTQNPLTLASAHLKTSKVVLPEGMTLDPSAAHELEACTPEQIKIGTNREITCPARSVIGTATAETPAVLPPGEPTEKAEGQLTGKIYLGETSPGPITGPPYTIYVAVESEKYGLGMRLRGKVEPDSTTGQLTTTFEENPQEPFSSLKLSFKGGPLAVFANPLKCGPASASGGLSPWSGNPEAIVASTPFTVGGDNAGGACASPLPFALTQSTSNQSSAAGALTSFTFNLGRGEGQQYLSQVKAVLPAGLLGPIPSVTLCGEAEANAGTCSANSQIGAAAVTAGSGPTPFAFTGGRVYLTGPYNGAPYGLSIVVPAEAGPFSLGNVVTRATINVEPYTYRLVVTSTLPRVFKGIPLRLRNIAVAINRQSFLSNPTSCAALSTDSTLSAFITPGSGEGATQNLSSPFQVGECDKLAFKPSFSAITGSKTSKANGASIEVSITQPAKQSNIRQVTLQLPKQLPSRLTTLRKACLAATFEAGPPPGACPTTARVGSATVTTPVLPDKLTGPAYLVSHGGQAFPDLDLILQGDGVTVVLVGHTNISNSGITTSKFETLPDAPLTNAVVTLPTGPQSLLAANGNLCKSRSKLIAPTTIVGQSGAKITQKTKISVRNCPVLIVKHRTSGTRALVTVKTPAAGRVSGSGTDLKFVTRHLKKAGQVTLSVPLTRTGAEVLRKFGRLRLRLRVGFVPKTGHLTSKAYATVTFRS